MNSEEKMPESAVQSEEDKTTDTPSPKPKDTGKPKDTTKLKKVFENDGYNKMNEAIGRMLGRLRKEHNMSVCTAYIKVTTKRMPAALLRGLLL